MKGDVHSSVRRTLAKKHACYVLITCEQAASDGSMKVQMSYEGDTALASYLLVGAQNQIDQEDAMDSEVFIGSGDSLVSIP